MDMDTVWKCHLNSLATKRSGMGSYRTATFHPFPRLPFELRAQIWEMTVEPRVVDVRVAYSNEIMEYGRRLVSSTSTPAILHVCREARDHGLYEKGFSEIASRGVGFQHVWVNFDIDIIDIGASKLYDYKPVARLV
ncbi:hypothetical protein P154DRAFT_590260 [Amniculicola lignicola CBS 123094]|uniref:2EXR domain-containing protein n=1 Tax=Amniculicola lignicola CBS 123094 TaxID=1392246 RepID=A0A6A5WQ13_9PLEO|nr:hypothetical protein P154DRAFT_590260 [Amniculicola lignicola CBS 123094]